MNNGEFQQMCPVLFQRAPVARWVTQKISGELSLALKASLADLAIGAPQLKENRWLLNVRIARVYSRHSSRLVAPALLVVVPVGQAWHPGEYMPLPET